MKECQTCKRCFSEDPNYCHEDGSLLISTLPDDVLIGGRYQLQNKIRDDGIGRVYRAHHLYLKTNLQLTIILRDAFVDDPDFITRFPLILVDYAIKRHPNLVSIHDFGVSQEGSPYYVFAASDKTLDKVIAAKGRLPLKLANSIIEQLISGLQEIRQTRGFLSGSPDPVRIMLREKPLMVNETTFLKNQIEGLFLDPTSMLRPEDRTRFYQLQSLKAASRTFPYKAPELLSGADNNEISSIYSLGVMLFEMSGKGLSFKSENIRAAVDFLNEKDSSLPASEIPMPPDLEALLDRALDRDPQKRHQSLEEFLAEVKKLPLLTQADFDEIHILTQADFDEIDILSRSADEAKINPISGDEGITLLEAKLIALKVIGPRNALAGIKLVKQGWLFSFNSKDYLRTGNSDHQLIGNNPFIVNKADGRIINYSIFDEMEEMGIERK